MTINGQQCYIVTIIDHFSKYAEAVILPEIKSLTIWRAVYTRWIAVWGCPTYLLSDNGAVFTSKDFKRKCAELGIQKIFSTPYHPQGNGVVEAFHQFLNRAISAYVSQSNWDLAEIVASVMLAYRSTPHPSTGESPYYVMTGLDMVLPHFQDWAEYTRDTVEANKRFDLIAQVRRDCFDVLVKKCVNRMMKPPKQERPLKVGDVVICWLNPYEVGRIISRLGSRKFAPSWSEPCRVVRFINTDRSVVLVKSLWHRDLKRHVPVNDLTRLPDKLEAAELNMAKWELLADLKRFEGTAERKVNPLLPTEQVPARERDGLGDKCTDLQQQWLKTDLTEVTVDIDEDDHPPPPSTEEKQSKRVRVNWVAHWPY